MLASPSAPPPVTSPVRPRLRRVAAIVNARSGGTGPGAADALAALVARYGYEFTIRAPPPGEVTATARALVGESPDLLIVLAGDGTARLVAELCGPDGPLVAPLPGGTLNLLPHALYGPRAWPEALAALLDHGVERVVSGGRVGEHSFHVAAVLGAPALWSTARESVRAGHYRQAARRARYALTRAFSGGLRFSLDDRPTGHAEALVLISPVVSRTIGGQSGLEAAAIDIKSAGEVFRLAFNGLMGDWRRDPGVVDQACRRGRAWARRSIPCILDGEIYRMPREVEFAFRPRAFRALVPAREGA